MNTKDLSIVTQVAGKIASDVVQSDTAIAAVRDGVFAEITETVLSSLLDAMNVSTATAPVVQLAPEAQGHDAAVQNVLNQFDGATVTTDNTSVDYQPSPPTQIHSKSSMIEMLEDALFHNPDNWKVWDTEKASMNGGNSPDITHETLKQDGNNYKVGIFMVSRYAGQSAPEWAWTKLGKQSQYASLLAAGKITA